MYGCSFRYLETLFRKAKILVKGYWLRESASSRRLPLQYLDRINHEDAEMVVGEKRIVAEMDRDHFNGR